MNIQNISTLAEQLQSLGFEGRVHSLLRRISFKPANFILSQRVEKGKDKINFQLHFERDNKQGDYALMYYDAVLQKEGPLDDATINGVNTSALEKSMSEIDWKNAFDFGSKQELKTEDKASWEKELKVETVIEALLTLERSEEGIAIAAGLKLKYWAGMPYQELFGSISPFKNKSEISQRFYFVEGQQGISVDDAYRFLQNRWLEKQMQIKRKQPDELSDGETEGSVQSSSGGSLLKKKRIGRVKGTKSNKPVHN